MDWKTTISELMARGWRQVELARLAGCSQATISELKSGDAKDCRYGVGCKLIALHVSGTKPREIA